MKIYNTLTRNKEEFVPIEKGKVRMYVCGPTVYGKPHVGHAKSYVFFDVVYRYLTYLKYKVKYVQNITDVGHLVGDVDEGEDKIEKVAKTLDIDPYEIAYKYENEYFECMSKLNVLKPSISSRATGHIIEIIDFIKSLIDKGYAYVTEEGNVYYEVNKFKEYGKLSNRTLDETLSGERITVSTDKRNPEDFALWKKAVGGHIMKWDSPWSVGYPGWHIECSTMAKKYLGDTIDIHGGGMDNIFPHHDCEIAQSEIANGVNFVNYFIHNNLVTVNGTKMGKSLGNFITLEDLFKKYDPMVIRFYLLLNHYRKPTDFSDDKIEDAQKKYQEIVNIYNKILNTKKTEEQIEDGDITNLIFEYMLAMDDDFNTPLAISYIYEINKRINTLLNEGKTYFIDEVVDFYQNKVINILGLTFETNKVSNDSDIFVEYLLNLRKEMRDAKNYETSDKIRDFLIKNNIEVNDRRINQ